MSAQISQKTQSCQFVVPTPKLKAQGGHSRSIEISLKLSHITYNV